MQSMASIAPVILAAGDSTRMGYPKALLPLGKDIFLTRILGVIQKAGLPTPTVILGNAASVIQPRIREWPAEIWINPDPARGQLSSIQLALPRLRPEFDACLIWPVDQPAVSEELVCNLVRLFITSKPLIACPVFGGKRGHPAIYHRDLFCEFMDAPMEEGPKRILARHRKVTALLPTGESAVVQDIDTPSEYQALTGESLDSALSRRGITADPQS